MVGRYARLAERLKETGKTIVPNRLHLMRTPHEIALGSHDGDEISESEFAEPLAPAPAGAAWHVRLDRVNGARAPGHDDVKQLVVAMGATSCRRASPVADDGTAWCCDVETSARESGAFEIARNGRVSERRSCGDVRGRP